MQTATSSAIVGFFVMNSGPLIWRRGFERWQAKQHRREADSSALSAGDRDDDPTLQAIFASKASEDEKGVRYTLVKALISVTVMVNSPEFVYNASYMIFTLAGNFVHQFLFFVSDPLRLLARTRLH